jgi:AAA+ superfamily predicted ATPase
MPGGHSSHILEGASDISLKLSRGDEFRAIFLKVYHILALQFANPDVKGIKGFIFYGESGVGKTYMARVLAHELSVPLLFADSSTIARKHYGDSEHLISKLFEEGMHNKSLLLFDDVEALFLDRTKETAESWNMGQNNVLFHQLDKLDTSKCAVIFTTNMISFLDKALRDRLYPVEFPVPNLDTLIAIARMKCGDLKINSEGVEKTIRAAPNNFRSIRAVEKSVLDEYVMQVESRVKRDTLLAQWAHERTMMQ